MTLYKKLSVIFCLFWLVPFHGHAAVRENFGDMQNINGKITIINASRDDEVIKSIVIVAAGNSELNIRIQKDKASSAITAINAGKADFIILESLAAQPAPMQGELDGFPYAVHAIAIAVNVNNPLSDISLENLRKIYAGEITYWKDTGGSQYTIHLFGKPPGSPAYTLLQEALMQKTGFTKNIFFLPNTRSIAVLLGANKNGLGFFDFDPLLADLKFLKIEGVTPGRKSIAAGKYPLSRLYYLCYRKKNLSANANAFLKFIKNPEIIALVGKAGLVSPWSTPDKAELEQDSTSLGRLPETGRQSPDERPRSSGPKDF